MSIAIAVDAAIPAASRRPLARGRWANAVVWLEDRADGAWVVKDFSERWAPIREILGTFLVRRELEALRRCAGIAGVPRDAHRRGPFALAYRFQPGQILRETAPTALTPAFFEALEATVRAMHERGIVHNDLRNARNLIVGTDGSPGVIDFQSYLDTRRLPRFIRRRLEMADLSGVYKHWERLLPESLDAARREYLDRANRWRRLWIFRGYFGFSRNRNGEERG